eukprot:1161191-Pelagomonas_calceolata.AAC.3
MQTHLQTLKTRKLGENKIGKTSSVQACTEVCIASKPGGAQPGGIESLEVLAVSCLLLPGQLDISTLLGMAHDSVSADVVWVSSPGAIKE